MVRFLHVADLHLGMRITRFAQDAIEKIREARFQALENVRELARRDDGIRFVLVAGDLFDDVRVERTIAHRAYKLLESFPVPVLVISGNHDPLEPGSVWDSDPWNQTGGTVRVLRERAPVEAVPGVTLFPCPVFRKTSTENPTRWIAAHPRTAAQGFRIAVAHGSVMDRPGLPDDDHPISPTAAADLDLDYLALGHWHRTKIYRDTAGAPRIVYPGVHEPMRFPGDANSTGWRPYSSGGEREEFLDGGRGVAMVVTIDRPGAAPTVEEREVGYHRWTVRDAAVQSEDEINLLIAAVAEAPETGRTLLRLRLSGTVPLRTMERLDEVREVLGRYVVGEIDDTGLLVEPTEDEIREIVGSGILRTVFERLQTPAANGSGEATNGHAAPGSNGNGHAAAGGEQAEIARRATLLLYRYALQARERS